MGKCWVYILLVLAYLICITGCKGSDNVISNTNSNIDNAKKFVTDLSKGDYASAESQFAAIVAKDMPESKLKETWQMLETQIGSFQQLTGTRTIRAGGYDGVVVACKFEKSELDIKLFFDASGKISGLWFVPHTEDPGEFKSASYVKPGSFIESDVSIGSSDMKLPGTLSIPKGKGVFPVVILVHGSGPNDRDETIGPNKPFRDLAEGLASKGIAVLRYDKRTKVYPTKMMSNITVKDETIDDVIIAVNQMRKTPKIDPKRIFVLGHSLGGMLIPRIAARGSGISGFIVMAGAARQLENAMIEQFEYIFNADGSISDEEKKQLDAIKVEVAKVQDPKLSIDGPSILGGPPSYWLDLRGYHPPVAAKQIKQPLLVLQGGRDYQVTVKDFAEWKKSLASKKNVKFKLYPALNHLFIAGKGKSTPSEYEIMAHVDLPVINDITSFVLHNK
ncbi:MAG: alpha/beta hydrolase [Armatimonadota bacterium]